MYAVENPVLYLRQELPPSLVASVRQGFAVNSAKPFSVKAMHIRRLGCIRCCHRWSDNREFVFQIVDTNLGKRRERTIWKSRQMVLERCYAFGRFRAFPMRLGGGTRIDQRRRCCRLGRSRPAKRCRRRRGRRSNSAGRLRCRCGARRFRRFLERKASVKRVPGLRRLTAFGGADHLAAHVREQQTDVEARLGNMAQQRGDERRVVPGPVIGNLVGLCRKRDERAGRPRWRPQAAGSGG
jgi:hypothetical protein